MWLSIKTNLHSCLFISVANPITTTCITAHWTRAKINAVIPQNRKCKSPEGISAVLQTICCCHRMRVSHNQGKMSGMSELCRFSAVWWPRWTDWTSSCHMIGGKSCLPSLHHLSGLSGARWNQLKKRRKSTRDPNAGILWKELFTLEKPVVHQLPVSLIYVPWIIQ